MKLPRIFKRWRKAWPFSYISGSAWYPVSRIGESFPGAWQQNVEIDQVSVRTYFAVFSCMTLIASDIAKLGVRLVKQARSGGVWSEITDPRYSPVLKIPNSYQTRIQFWEHYVLAKLSSGNVYVLLHRNAAGNVVRLTVLDPCRVKPLLSPNGAVFYELNVDELAGIEAQTISVPASEIIHDRMNCLYHPLIGLSPIVAGGLAAMQGYNMQNDSALFFANRGLPGGILTAPGAISDETADRLKVYFTDNFTGTNAGNIAVVGDGLKFEQLRISAVDSQVIEQLRWTAEVVCSVFHVPPYKIGIGAMPTYNNIQALNVEYYSQALQILIESAELCVDQGLGVPDGTGIEFDLRDLLRMDSQTQIARLKEAVAAGIMSPNEGRLELNLPPKKGGDTPYLQQQNYSLAALDERDKNAPAPSSGPAAPPAGAPPPDPPAPPPREISVEHVRNLFEQGRAA